MIKEILIRSKFFWVLWVFLLGIFEGYMQDTSLFVIGTGKRQGNYYKAGAYIARAYNKAFPGKKFFFIETDGSNENIRLLRQRALDFGLIQRNVLINSIYDREKGAKNLSVVVPLYKEELQVYFKGHRPLPLEQITTLNKNGKWKVGLTSKSGYSYQIFSTILKFLNIDLSKMELVTGNYAQLHDSLKNGNIDAVVSFSLPIRELESLPGAQKMYLSEPAARLIQNRINNLFISKKKPGQYNVGTWSFLVANKRSLEKLDNSDKLITALTANAIDSTNDENFGRIIARSIRQFSDHPETELKKLRRIPLSKPFLRVLPKRNFSLSWVLIPLFIILSFLFYFKFFRTKIELSEKTLFYYWQRYKHFAFGLLALFIIFVVSVELLRYYEKLFYNDTGKMSPLLNLTRNDLYSWIVITTATGNSDGIFPYSMAGKVMLALNSMNFWIGTILIGTAELVAIRINKKRKKGLMESKFTNHIIIFGWNSSAEKLILDLMEDAKKYIRRKLQIVAVVPDTQYVRDNYAKIRYLHDVKRIDLITGDALDFHALEMANTHMADTVILLADDNTTHADERTVMRALAISRFTKTKKSQGNLYKTRVVETVKQKAKDFFNIGKTNETVYKRYDVQPTADSIYMIAEINDPKFRESLIDAEVNEIMISGNYRRAIIKQSVFNHGISRVIDEIVNYNEFNEFYKIDLSQEQFAKLRGKTFDELMVALRRVGILLVAIHIIFHDKDGNIIIDRQIIKHLLKEKENGLTRDIIVNPIDPKERNRPVDEDDHLIVLAKNYKLIEKGIRELHFDD